MTTSAAQTTGPAEPAPAAGQSGTGAADRGRLAVAAAEAITALSGPASEPGGPGNGGTSGNGPAATAKRPGGESPAGSGLAAISPSEARALIELVAARGIAQGQLGGLLGLEKSTVSRLAAGLERKGWIRRGRDEDNQRYIRLYLTPEGRAVAARVLNAWQSRQARILAALSADERAGLEAGLRGLVRGLAAEGIIGDPAAGGDGR
jgi:DNA-binding MarR family transcriptional regulator